LEAERGAIEVYEKLIDFLHAGNGDPVTFHVIRHILQEEMEHEEEVETLLDSNHNAIKKTPRRRGAFSIE